MSSIRDYIYRAALLHDVGWPLMLAGKGQLTPEIRAWAKKLTPAVDQEQVLWTAQFHAEHSLDTVDHNVLPAGTSSLDLASRFLNPAHPLEKIIAQARRLADGSVADQYASTASVSALQPVLARVAANETQDYGFHLGLHGVAYKDFPQKGIKNLETSLLGALCQDFVEEFQKLKPVSSQGQIETIASLLDKYFSTIPCSNSQLSDVPFSVHARSTAAFALCLYDYLKEQGREDQVEIEQGEKPILLIGGDLSGIQAYLYNIIGKSAAKNLKGRSFYLEMLVHSVISLILDRCSLRSSNLIYASGGGFYLLAPNTRFVREQLEMVSNLVHDSMLKHDGPELFLALGSLAVTFDQFQQENGIASLWRDLRERLNREKRHRYAGHLSSQYDTFFTPLEAGGLRDRDAITGEEIEGDPIDINYSNDGSGLLVARKTFEQIRLGRELRSARLWVSSLQPIAGVDGQPFQPGGLPVFHYLLPNHLPRQVYQPGCEVCSFNSIDFLPESIDAEALYRFTYIAGNEFPADEDGSPKTFDMLAGEGGLRRLGMLRMDVDNLGSIFGRGFHGQSQSLARLTTLSKSLDQFFSGHLATLVRDTPEFQQYVNILYSGGDDLFLIGRWDVLADLAIALRKRFGDWTCHNPAFGFSGGLAVVGPKHPLAKGAELAAELEKQSKSYHLSLDGMITTKDAFSILGMTLRWSEDLSVVSDLRDEIFDLLENRRLSRSLIRQISGFTAHRAIDVGGSPTERWRWLLAYQLARAGKDLKIGSSEAEFIARMKVDLFCDTHRGRPVRSQYSMLQLINLAGSWADLQLRTIDLGHTGDRENSQKG